MITCDEKKCEIPKLSGQNINPLPVPVPPGPTRELFIRFITKNSQYENWELYYYQKDGGYIIFIFDKNLINETITPKMVANKSVGYCEFNINNINYDSLLSFIKINDSFLKKGIGSLLFAIYASFIQEKLSTIKKININLDDIEINLDDHSNTFKDGESFYTKLSCKYDSPPEPKARLPQPEMTCLVKDVIEMYKSKFDLKRINKDDEGEEGPGKRQRRGGGNKRRGKLTRKKNKNKRSQRKKNKNKRSQRKK